MDKFDIVIIGGGPGGYVAALRAAQLKLKVAVVEERHLGGICLNWGCIPTKALLRASEIHHQLHNLAGFGFSADNIQFNIRKIVERSRSVSRQLSKGVAHLLKKAKVTVYEGRGALDGQKGGDHIVAVSQQGNVSVTLAARHVIIATGARARQLPGLETGSKTVWSYREALVPDSVPKRLLVIGTGAIGVEFASFYRQMGAEVTLIDVAPRILPVEDEEISALAEKAFTKQGIKIITSAQVGALKQQGDHVTAHIEAKGQATDITVDRVIVAVGIVGNVENLGLEKTKAKIEKTHIVTDGYGRTAEENIWAIGDVAGAPWLAHKASHEGIIVVEKIAGLHPEKLHPLNIPGCTFSYPQIASVGLTEAKAKEAGRAVTVGRFPFVGNGKALAMGETEGLVKTIFDAETGELLGAHMIGAEVSEMIQGYVIAKTGELTEAELKETVFPHPTISESMHEAVLAAWGGALHF